MSHLSLPHPAQSPLRFALRHPIRAFRDRRDASEVVNDFYDPDFDFVETPEGWSILGDLPGIPERALEIRFDRDVIVIAGEREAESEVRDAQLLVQERSWGGFVRSFPLPEGADPERAEASFVDGVLTVHLPRKSAPVKIAVREG